MQSIHMILMQASGVVKRKKFNPPMKRGERIILPTKTGERIIPTCTEEIYGNLSAQAAGQESKRDENERLVADEEELCNHVSHTAHTLLSYCDDSKDSTVTESDSDDINAEDSLDSERKCAEDEDNEGYGPPRRYFKTARSEPCKYNFSVLPNSKRIRPTHKTNFVPETLALSSKQATVLNTCAVFEFPDSQLCTKQKAQQLTQERTESDRKQEKVSYHVGIRDASPPPSQVARDHEVLQTIASIQQEIQRIHERYAVLRSALVLG